MNYALFKEKKHHTFIVILLIFLTTSCTVIREIGPVPHIFDSICETEQKPIVKTGLEVFLDNPLTSPSMRYGLMTNQTGVDHNLISNVGLLNKKVNLCVLYSPEHGLYGAEKAGDQVDKERDFVTGIRSQSTYGLTPEQIIPLLDGVDIILFDIQDIGIRSYTYIYSMANLMKAASIADKKVIILDRPNPITGVYVEGNVLDPKLSSFVGMYQIPYRHGMTVGELALLFNNEFDIDCNLEVIPMKGWERDMWFDETGLCWVPTSPHVPHPEMILPMITTGVYGELGILSEGVGTTLPFEYSGGPWIHNPYKFSELLQDRICLGVKIRPTFFKPFYGRYKGLTCGGVQLHITDRDTYQPYITGLIILDVHNELYPDIDLFENKDRHRSFDRVTGATWIREELQRGTNPKLLKKRWEKDLAKYLATRQKYFLYD